MGSHQMVSTAGNALFANLEAVRFLLILPKIRDEKLRGYTMKAITRGARRPNCAAAIVLLTFAALPAVADSEVEAILHCKAMQDDAARLACYDGLNNQAGAAPEAVAPPSAPTSAPPVAVEPTTERPASAAPDLNDDVGRESLRKDSEQLMVRGQVVKCYKDVRKKYVFNFANGQVWRQKGNKKIRWKDCDFEVTIRKDFFGYVMQPVGDEKDVRIARVR